MKKIVFSKIGVFKPTTLIKMNFFNWDFHLATCRAFSTAIFKNAFFQNITSGCFIILNKIVKNFSNLFFTMSVQNIKMFLLENLVLPVNVSRKFNP